MKSFVKLIAAGLVLSSAAEAEEVNVYSYRQPELIKHSPMRSRKKRASK